MRACVTLQQCIPTCKLDYLLCKIPGCLAFAADGVSLYMLPQSCMGLNGKRHAVNVVLCWDHPCRKMWWITHLWFTVVHARFHAVTMQYARVAFHHENMTRTWSPIELACWKWRPLCWSMWKGFGSVVWKWLLMHVFQWCLVDWWWKWSNVRQLHTYLMVTWHERRLNACMKETQI